MKKERNGKEGRKETERKGMRKKGKIISERERERGREREKVKKRMNEK